MASHLLTATNATSCRTSRNHKYAEAPVVRVVAHRGDWYRPDELVNPHATLPLFGQRPEPALRPTKPTAPTSAIEALPLTATAKRILQGEVVTRRPDSCG
jgi:hypothetical protein